MALVELRRRNNSPLWAEILDEDEATVSQYRWRSQLSRNTYYAATTVKRATGGYTVLYLHRLLCPQWAKVDHIDHNGLNNRRENLRDGVRNDQNRLPQSGTSDFKGVSKASSARKWRAAICVAGKSFHIGFFESEAEAAKAYDVRAVVEFGEYAYLNFPSG